MNRQDLWNGWVLPVVGIGAAAWVGVHWLALAIVAAASYELGWALAVGWFLAVAAAVGWAQEKSLGTYMPVQSWTATVVIPAILLALVNLGQVLGIYSLVIFDLPWLTGAVAGLLVGGLVGWMQKGFFDRRLRRRTGLTWPLANMLGVAAGWVASDLVGNVVGAAPAPFGSLLVVAPFEAVAGLLVFAAVTGFGLTVLLGRAEETEYTANPVDTPARLEERQARQT